jgi:hypothetical protein
VTLREATDALYAAAIAAQDAVSENDPEAARAAAVRAAMASLDVHSSAIALRERARS